MNVNVFVKSYWKQTARTIEVRAVLRHDLPNKGLHPLHRYAAIPADFAIGAIC